MVTARNLATNVRHTRPQDLPVQALTRRRRAPSGRGARVPFLDFSRVVDTHAHLSLCEPPAAELVAAAREAGVRRILDDRDRRGDQPRGGRGLGGVRRGVRERRAPPELGRRLRRRPRPRRSPRSPPSRRSWRSERPGSTTTATVPRGPTSVPPSPPRSRSPATPGLPVVIHVRDPEGSTEAVDEAFATLEARARGPGDPALLLRAAAGRTTPPSAAGICSFAGNVTYPKAEELREAAAAGPRGAAPGRDRLSLPGAAAGQGEAEPARQRPSPPPRVIAEVRGVSSERLERHRRGQRRAPAGLVSAKRGRPPPPRLGQNFLADTNLLDAIVRESGVGPAGRRARDRRRRAGR